jgi:multidrug efflux pump subunit AcrA (membrane-fusion protein)
MFVRVAVVLERIESATIVPRDALVPHGDGHAAFVVGGDGHTASLRPVTVGVSDGERVQVWGVEAPERVITLGQALLHDGAAIVLPEAATATPEGEPPP